MDDVGATRRGSWRAWLVLAAFCVHNFWNCWTFLNLITEEAWVELLPGMDHESFGLLGSLSWIGIFAVTLFVSFATGYERSVLVAGMRIHTHVRIRVNTRTHAHEHACTRACTRACTHTHKPDNYGKNSLERVAAQRCQYH